MAKFCGEIGFSLGQVEREDQPGVYEEGIVEHKYYGDILRNTRQLENGDKVLSDVTVGNSISIVADAYANEHFFAMRYIRWAGTLWVVSDVEVQRPRLLLRLGGVYNGPTAAPIGPA